jgi:hypothetical protein
MRNLAPAKAVRLDDVPAVVLCDRRKSPDRRTPWRGGRRDSDWINRPLGALAEFARHQRNRARLWF